MKRSHWLILIALSIGALLALLLMMAGVGIIQEDINLWFEGLIYIFFGLALASFTLFPAVAGWMRWRDRRGSQIDIDRIVITVSKYDLIIDQSITVKGVSPYRLILYTSYFGEEITFRSPYIWKDPTPYLPEKIQLTINPHRWNDYWIDLSFLSKDFF